MFTCFSCRCFACYNNNSQNSFQCYSQHLKLIENLKLIKHLKIIESNPHQLNPVDSPEHNFLQTLLSPINKKNKFLRLGFLKTLLRPGFLLITASCQDGALLLSKFDIPLIRLNRLKLLIAVTCGIIPPMLIGGFIPMMPLLLLQNSPLHTSVQLSRLPREMFWSQCPRL